MECEICGSEADGKAEIEGAVLNVCRNCAGSGRDIIQKQPKILKLARLPEEMRSMLIEDFSRAIKTAREKRHLSQEHLASAVKEKTSIIKRIEEGWNPPLQTARKLELFFGLKLIDKVQDNAEKMIVGRKEITIADIAIIKRKANKNR